MTTLSDSQLFTMEVVHGHSRGVDLTNCTDQTKARASIIFTWSAPADCGPAFYANGPHKMSAMASLGLNESGIRILVWRLTCLSLTVLSR